MADTTLSLFTVDGSTKSTQFTALIKVVYQKPFLATLDKDVFVYQLFNKKSIKDVSINWKYKDTFNTSTEFHAEDDAVGGGVDETGTAASSDYTPAVWRSPALTVKYARSHVVFSEPTEVMTDSAWVSMKAEEITSALDDLKNGLNDSIIRFVDNNDTLSDLMPTTICEVVSDGSTTNSNAQIIGKATYAGIDRATIASFRSYVLGAAASRSLTVALMQQMWANLMKPARAANPASMVILTTPAISDAYGDIADARRRWAASGMQGTIDLAYSDFAYHNVPILAPPKWHVVGTNISDMYFLDKSDWQFHVGLPFDVQEIPPTSAAPMNTTVLFKHWFQLVCKAPWKQGCISDLASTY